MKYDYDRYLKYGMYNQRGVFVNQSILYHTYDIKSYQFYKMEKELTSAEMLRSSFFRFSIYKIQFTKNIFIRAPPSFLYFTKEI